MTLEEEAEAMTLKRRLRVLYRNCTVTIHHELAFKPDDYQDVSSASAVIQSLATQLTAYKNTQEIKQKEETKP